MTSQEYCKIAVAALEDRKAEDVKIIDIREISPVADYFVTVSYTHLLCLPDGTGRSGTGAG